MQRYDNGLQINSSANFGLTVAHAGNEGFEIAGISCFAGAFVQGGSSVSRTKCSTKTPRRRKP